MYQVDTVRLYVRRIYCTAGAIQMGMSSQHTEESRNARRENKFTPNWPANAKVASNSLMFPFMAKSMEICARLLFARQQAIPLQQGAVHEIIHFMKAALKFIPCFGDMAK